MARKDELYTDLRHVPKLTFAFVENYAARNSRSSGRKNLEKGFMYYSEGYIHHIRTSKLDNGSRVAAKCYHSQRRNETPHNLEVFLSVSLDVTTVNKASCSCTIGQSGTYGHVVGLLYQLANYKTLGKTFIPGDVAKTSLPQTWHMPRGDRIKGQTVHTLEVRGQHKKEESKPLKSTLYNPVRTTLPDLAEHVSSLRSIDNSVALLTVLPDSFPHNVPMVSSTIGSFPKGSHLSYQQKLHSDFLMNIFNPAPFPDLPFSDQMLPSYATVLSESQSLALSALTPDESIQIERSTRLQSSEPRWLSLRKDRVTASHAGEIFKKGDRESYARKLKTATPRRGGNLKFGLDNEHVAAQEYSQQKNQAVNIYPCGLVIHPRCCWLAATPDRKIYDPSTDTKFGLLEIKSVVAPDLSNVDYLHRRDGVMSLKKTKNHYYQIQMQLAVTGLSWCDFFVWSEQETHLERIVFDSEKWSEIQANLDAFFFEYYL